MVTVLFSLCYNGWIEMDNINSLHIYTYRLVYRTFFCFKNHPIFIPQQSATYLFDISFRVLGGYSYHLSLFKPVSYGVCASRRKIQKV